MTELLSKLFIKNHTELNNPMVRKKYGTLTSIVGIVTNVILATMKLIIGLLSSSVAIIADSANNFSDAGSSIITLVSFKLSSKPADKDHPFGHARMEYVASMIVSFLILLVGSELFMDSAKTLLGLSEGTQANISPITLIILLVSVLLKLWLGIFQAKIGKKINSGVIKASSTDSLADAISTTAVLISSIVIKLTNWYYLDAIMGIVVSVLVFIAGINILNETKNAILGEAPIDETVESIKNVVSEFPEILGMHDLLVHNYGPHHFIASFHAEVDGNDDIYYLHDVIDNVERKINNELNILCTIHMDPVVTDDDDVNELKGFLIEVLKDEDLNLSIHDFRVVIGETHTNLIFDVVIPFDYPISEAEVKKKICDAVFKRRENCYCVITVDRG